jgi:hypothetical protein
LLVLATTTATAPRTANEPHGPPYMPLDPTRDPWAQLKERHAGQECLYIGNGPSLTKMDWSFVDVARIPVIFGVNKIYLGLRQFNLRLTYLAATNRRILTGTSLNAFLGQATPESGVVDRDVVKFVRADRWMQSAEYNAAHNVVPIRSISTCSRSACRYAVPKPEGGTDELGHKRVSYRNDTTLCDAHCRSCFCDASAAYVEGNTVTYAALQLLYLMGCQRVYLVGVDHRFEQQGAANTAQLMLGSDPNHFHPLYFGGNQTWDLADLPSSELHYRLAKERFEDDGREVVDLTVGGRLNVFRKADYRELFKPTGGRARKPNLKAAP